MPTQPTPEEIQAIMSDASKLRHYFQSMPEDFWVTSGKQAALQTFQQAAQTVPAYRDFLLQHDISPADLTAENFDTLPVVTKDNYFDRYPLPDLVMGGDAHVF